jgi:hypothetical protein
LASCTCFESTERTAALCSVNFTTTGFDIEGGHEVELHESWVGACWYTPPSSCWLNSSALGSTTGILINGNDHILDNVVVFAGLVGVAVRGAANLVTATHTWNTQSGAVPAGIGIDVSVWQNRFVSPYLDYVPLVCRGCALTVITDGFFLGGAQIIFEPDPNAYPVRGVFISGSVYAGLGDGVPDIIALPPPKNGANFSGVQVRRLVLHFLPCAVGSMLYATQHAKYFCDCHLAGSQDLARALNSHV